MAMQIFENDELIDEFEGSREECMAYFDEHYGLGEFEYTLN